MNGNSVEDTTERGRLLSRGGSHYAVDPVVWLDRLGVGRRHYILALVLGLGNAADAVEVLGIGYILTVYTDRAGDTMSPHEREFLTASVFFGMLIGGLVCGVLSDRIGRKPCLMYSLAINGIAGVASALVPTTQLLILCRMVAGVGVGGSVPSVFTLCAEMFPTARRGFFINVVAWFWVVGAVFAAGSGWVLLGDTLGSDSHRIVDVSWRYFAAICAFPALLTLVLCFFIPESPHYLALKENHKAAHSLLWLARGSKEVDAVDLQYLEDAAARRVVMEDKESLVHSVQQYHHNDDSPVEKSATGAAFETLRLLWHPTYRRSTLTLGVMWLTLSFGGYGISTWITVLFKAIGLDNPYASAFLFAGAQAPGSLLGAWAVDWWGRRKLMVCAMGTSAVMSTLFAVGKQSGAALVIPVACVFSASNVMGWQALDCLSAESCPTRMRTTAMGAFAAGGRLGSMAAQFVNGALMGPPPHVASLLFVTSGTLAVGALSGLLLRETAGVVLEGDLDEAQTRAGSPTAYEDSA